MILMLAAAALSAQQPAPPATSGPETVVCGRSMSYEDQVCAALMAGKEWRHEDAAAAYEKAAQYSVSDTPKAARAYAAAGNMWIVAGQPGKAAVALDRALASKGLDTGQRGDVLLDRARAAEAQNDLKTARAKVTEAAAIIPQDPFLWYFSAALAIREGDSAAAKGAIDRALALAPNDPLILFEAGHVAQFEGNTAGARAYWTRAARLDPNGPAGKAAKEAIALLDSPAVVQKEPQTTK